MAEEGTERDRAFMLRALALAERGWGWTAPNPMVGAVVVRDGRVVGEGFHARFGGEHAEIAALRDAGERARGATMYVTLEPCAHWGKTPPCADALAAAGVARVVAAAADPTADAAGGGARLLREGVRYEVGVEGEESRRLNAPFFWAAVSDRPLVTLKLALSADDAIAPADRGPTWLTGPESRREVHRLRAGSDGIAIGVGTALADDPLLTVREWPAPRVAPARIVFDRTVRLPATSRLARGARESRTWVVAERPDATRAALLAGMGVEVFTASSLVEALRGLAARGVRALLVEGGAELATAFLANEVADRLITFTSPVTLGAGALRPLVALPEPAAAALEAARVVRQRRFGGDIMTELALR
ncbi:MAG: bifunctional diaminohydroxyphosphoribosylaminopyrimidine deaminase/5-amino-6-(5-phosphoribosylamino)uracil reductase RibD [Gemmatimonadaceae bacterium]